jgi:hypothetical protein
VLKEVENSELFVSFWNSSLAPSVGSILPVWIITLRQSQDCVASLDSLDTAFNDVSHAFLHRNNIRSGMSDKSRSQGVLDPKLLGSFLRNLVIATSGEIPPTPPFTLVQCIYQDLTLYQPCFPSWTFRWLRNNILLPSVNRNYRIASSFLKVGLRGTTNRRDDARKVLV